MRHFLFQFIVAIITVASAMSAQAATPPNPTSPPTCGTCNGNVTWPKLPLACLPSRAERWKTSNEMQPCHCPPQSYCPKEDAVTPENLTFYFDFTVIGSKPPYRECSWSKAINVTCTVKGTEIEGLQEIIRKGEVFGGDLFTSGHELLEKLQPLVQARCQNQDITDRKEQCGHPGGAWVALDVVAAVENKSKTLLDWVNDMLQMPVSLATRCCDSMCPDGKIPSIKPMTVQIVTKVGNGEGTYEDCEDETAKLKSLEIELSSALQAASAAEAAASGACSAGADGKVDDAACQAASDGAASAEAAAAAAQQAVNSQLIVKQKACDIPTYNSKTIGVETVSCGINTHYPREGCMSEGTQITMADGTTKNVEDVKIDDMVKGNEGPAKVLATTRFTQTKDSFYSINGGQATFTIEHPVLTKRGWKSVDPKITSTKNSQTKVIGKLEVGDKVLTKDGEVEVKSIEKVESEGTVSAYNLKVGGDGSIIANGFIIKGFNQMQMHY